MNKKQEEQLDEMVRDFCQVVPQPKSLVRRRINSLLKAQRKEIIEKIEKMKQGVRKEEDEKWAIHYRGYNQALKDIIKQLK